MVDQKLEPMHSPEVQERNSTTDITVAGRPHHHAGFSLVEVGISMTLMSVIAGFVMLNAIGISPRLSADEALNQTVAQIRRGRELAISGRRNVEIKFLGTNQIQLVRYEVPAGTTVLGTFSLANKVAFRQFDGVPDTPDSFGNYAPVDFGGATQLIFHTDGTLVDQQGNPRNGSVFIGVANHSETARAATILGGTGRVRGYRWAKTEWTK